MAYKQKSSPLNKHNTGRGYDYKEAYNKNLTDKERLHYLENARHDAPMHAESRYLSETGDVIGETAQRSGSFMSKHTQSGLNYGSPLHVMGGDTPEKTAKEKLADAKEARKAPRKAVRDARKDVKTENKTKRQKDRATAKQTFKGEAAAAKTASDATNTANKLERIEKGQVRKDYRQAKSDVKDAGKKGDKYTTDSTTGVRTKNPKQKKASRKFVKDKATKIAAEKAAKRAKAPTERGGDYTKLQN